MTSLPPAPSPAAMRAAKEHRQIAARFDFVQGVLALLWFVGIIAGGFWMRGRSLEHLTIDIGGRTWALVALIVSVIAIVVGLALSIFFTPPRLLKVLGAIILLGFLAGPWSAGIFYALNDQWSREQQRSCVLEVVDVKRTATITDRRQGVPYDELTVRFQCESHMRLLKIGTFDLGQYEPGTRGTACMKGGRFSGHCISEVRLANREPHLYGIWSPKP